MNVLGNDGFGFGSVFLLGAGGWFLGAGKAFIAKKADKSSLESQVSRQSKSKGKSEKQIHWLLWLLWQFASTRRSMGTRGVVCRDLAASKTKAEAFTMD